MFKNAKIGDRVWSFSNGWGTIDEITTESVYALIIKFDNKEVISYTFDGRFSTSDALPTLFWDEIKFEIPSKPKQKVKKWFGIFYVSIRNEWRVCGHGMTPALYNSLDEAEEDNAGVGIKKFFEIEVEE